MGIPKSMFRTRDPPLHCRVRAPGWEKPGTTQAEFNADKYACEAQARALTQAAATPKGASASWSRQRLSRPSPRRLTEAR